LKTVDPDKKYLFIEDKHHIGDLDLLENEATKGENSSNMIAFTIMFVIIGAGSVFCCYLNYYLDSALSKYVFYMFLIAFVGDILLIRILLILLLTLIKLLISCCKGYKRLRLYEVKLKTDLGKSIKEMMLKSKTSRKD